MPILTKVECFNDDRNKISEMMYYGNIPLVGDEIVLDADGDLLAKIPYSHGKKHGTERVYAKDRKVSMLIRWHKGKQSGRQAEYEDGKLVRSSEWREGKLHGLEEFYDSYQDCVKTVEWKWGRKHGKEIEYDSMGREKSVVFWNRGKRFGRKIFFDSRGKRISFIRAFLRELIP